MSTHLEKAFRKLREQWFNRHLRSYAPEREDEDYERATAREEGNASLKSTYDEDTDAIIAGSKRAIAPTCGYDLEQGRKADKPKI